jgi:hypothetical protein
MTEHEYHIEVANVVRDIVPEDATEIYSLISNDCARKNSPFNQYALPIYHVKEDGYAIKYAYADILIVKDGLIKAQIEIEEQDRSATKLFGKVLTSAHCKFYEYQGRNGPRVKGPLPFSKDFVFIQIVRPVEAKNPENSQKRKQWEQIGKDITRMLEKGFKCGQDPWVRSIKYNLLNKSVEDNESELDVILKELRGN